MPDALSDAKATLAGANKKFPSPAKPAAAKPAVAKPAAKPSTMGDPTLAPSIKAKQDNINQYQQNAPKMHTGGVVPKTGVYTLQQGETVTPAASRQSEYRKVYIARKQKNDVGGNSPAPQGNEEKHDQTKAAKGTEEQKEF